MPKFVIYLYGDYCVYLQLLKRRFVLSKTTFSHVKTCFTVREMSYENYGSKALSIKLWQLCSTKCKLVKYIKKKIFKCSCLNVHIVHSEHCGGGGVLNKEKNTIY